MRSKRPKRPARTPSSSLPPVPTPPPQEPSPVKDIAASAVPDADLAVAPQEVVRATGEGVLRFGEVEVPCYVLADGTDLLTTAGITRIFASSKEGNLSGFLARIPGVPSDFSLLPSTRFRLPHNNAIADGYPASALIDLCNLYVSALAAGTLHPKQVPLAARAAVIVTACAKLGITALVWEATGYDKVKKASALQDRFAGILLREAGRWKLMFSRQFFLALARLYRLELRPGNKRPLCFAAFIAEFFYRFFELKHEGVYTELKLRNPKVKEHEGELVRAHCHHQFLTQDARDAFERHQRDVLLLMLSSDSLAAFRNRFNAVFRDGWLQSSWDF